MDVQAQPGASDKRATDAAAAAEELDTALTASMRAASAAQHAEIGPRRYADLICLRKQLSAQAEGQASSLTYLTQRP